MNTIEQFNAKLAEVKASRVNDIQATRLRSDVAINDTLRREAITSLTTTIEAIVDEFNLDVERTQRAIKAARKSEYGRVPELISIIAKNYAWPITDVSQASEIDDIQESMLDFLKDNGIIVSHDLLLDIKEAKGYHSFLDSATFEVIDGVEPEFDELEYYLLTFAEAAGLPLVDYKLEESKWNKTEAKVLAKIATEQAAAEEALANHNEMMSA